MELETDIENIEDIPDIEEYDYSQSGIVEEEFSEKPETYMNVVNEIEKNKNMERAAYKFYENPDIQKDIYSTIEADRSKKINLLEINSGNVKKVFNICHEESIFNKPNFSLKYKNEIICESENNTINGYITQIKKDWNRISDLRPFYSSKYDKFFSIKSDLRYISTKNNYNEYLTIVNSIFNYFLREPQEASEEGEEEFVIVDNNGEKLVKENIQVDNNTIGNISCGCSIKTVENRKETYNCKTFNRFTELSEKVKGILYKLLFVFQSSDVTIVNAINEYYNNITKCKYTTIQQSNKVRIEAFTYNDSYYYIDYKNKSLVSMFTINLYITTIDGRPIYIPIYKVIHVYPEMTSEKSYVFFYIENDPPSNVNTSSGMFSGFDYYKFIDEKIKWYISKPAESFTGLTYNGQDLQDYIKAQAELHKAKSGGKKSRKIKKSMKGKKKTKKSMKGKKKTKKSMKGKKKTKKSMKGKKRN
jgi:hypothetical protein